MKIWIVEISATDTYDEYESEFSFDSAHFTKEGAEAAIIEWKKKRPNWDYSLTEYELQD